MSPQNTCSQPVVWHLRCQFIMVSATQVPNPTTDQLVPDEVFPTPLLLQRKLWAQPPNT